MQKRIVSKLEVTTQQYIYKYLPINEFTIRSLINNELYFNSPHNFNDPFDCNCNFYRGTNEDAQLVNQYCDGVDKYLTDFEKEFSLKFRNILGVTCFSQIENNFLMWSHYANGHRGICLKFEWQKDSNFFKGCKVSYTNDLPIVGHPMSNKFVRYAKKVALTKLKPWNYEEEVREIITTENERLKKFNPLSLAGIIFGEKISDDDKTLIKSIINQHGRYKNLTYSQAEFNRETSVIDIKPVSSSPDYILG